MADVRASMPSSTTSVTGLRVVLEVINGSFAGRKAWLRAGQTLKIGRTERSDFVVPHDKNMSSLHFSLECGLGICKLRDCESANGTYVNDQPVAEHMLASGDVISAGTTKFKIEVEGARPQETVSAGTTIQLTQPKHVPPVAAKGKPPPYRLTQRTTGLSLLSGAAAEPSPAQVAGLLTRLGAELLLLADFNRLGQPLPAELTEPEYLFDWLPPEVAAMSSPLVLTRNDPVDPFAKITEFWGQGALVCLFSIRPKDQLLGHLRGIIRGKKSAGGPSPRNALIGICWPDILGAMLRDGPPNSHAYLFSQLTAVLIEGEENSWQLFILPDTVPKCQKLGFTPAPDPPPQAEAEQT